MTARRGARKRPDHERCTGTTKAGKRCRRKRAAGLDTCPQHAEDGARGGRPSLFTEEVADRIVELLRAGGLPAGVARAVGVAPATLASWLERGDQDRDGFDAKADEEFRGFRRRCDEARAAAEDEAVRSVLQAAKGGDWRAGAWYLERVAPDRWAGARKSSVSARDPSSPQSSAPPSGAPQLRVVDDLVAADGSAL